MEIEIINSLNETNESSIENSLFDSSVYIKTEDIISYISYYFNKLIEFNKNNKYDKNIIKNDIFYSKRIPNLTIEQYLIRIKKYSNIEDYTLIHAFIYIKKFIKKNYYIILINNIYRILLASCTISIKFLEDSNYKNSYISKIGGLNLEDMNAIEYYFYIGLNFNLKVTENELKKIEEELMFHKKNF